MRRWLRILGVAALAGAVLASAAVFLLYGAAGRWAVRSRVLPRLEKRLGVSVDCGAIDVERGHATLSDVAIGIEKGKAPLVLLSRVEVTFDFWSSLTGRPVVDEVVIHDPRFALERGDPRLRGIVQTLRSHGSGGGAGGGGGTPRPRHVVVMGGSLSMRDPRTGTTIMAGPLSADVHPGAPSKGAAPGGGVRLTLAHVAISSKLAPAAGADSVVLGFDPAHPVTTATATVEGGHVRLWRGMTLTGIHGTVAPGKELEHFDIDLAGSYGGMSDDLWKASGTVNPTERRGKLDLEAHELQLARLAPVLEGTPVVDPDQTTLGATLHIEIGPDGGTFSGQADVSNLSIFEPRLAEKPVRDVSARATVRGSVDASQRKLTLQLGEFVLGKVTYRLTGWAQLGDPAAPEEEPASKPRLAVHLSVPEVDCQTMLESIPPDFVPYLVDFQLGGRFSTELDLAIDWADLDSTVLAGSVGLRGCKVLKAPKDLSAERLEKPFEHWVEVEDGKWVSFEVGPDNPDFVPLDQISPHLVNSIMTTEDSRFYRHHGFLPSEFRAALIKDLKAGYFRYGASSITMQMVKNVVLYREKTISRKFQELFFTWYLESELEKDRIMEIYLNVIEYGPGLYGIGPAAREYFDKKPIDLNPVEAAFFSSILPNPKRRYEQFCDGQLTRWTRSKIQRILSLMHERDRLGEDEYMLAAVTPLEFAIRDDVSPRECKERAERFLEDAAEHGESAQENPRKR